MRKYAVVALLVTFFSMTAAYAKNDAPAKTDAVKKLEDSRQLIDQKKKELNGSEWQLDMTSSDAQGKAEKEVFTFQNGQVTCKMLTARGFKPTNYTISVPEGSDMAVWETMQTNDKSNVVFIRGEWKEDSMRGVISEQLEGGKTRDYSFASAGKIAVEANTISEEQKKAEAAKKLAEEQKAAEAVKAEATAPMAEIVDQGVAAAPKMIKDAKKKAAKNSY